MGVNYYAHINKLPHFVIKINIFGGNFFRGGRVANASYMGQCVRSGGAGAGRQK